MIERGELPFRYFGVGDEAYAVNEQMIVPFPGAWDHQSPEDNFNYFQSSMRIRIECAFGRLVQRFGILWKPLRCKLSFVAPVVFACMILHNICFSDSDFHHDDIDHVSPFRTNGTHANVPHGNGAEAECHDQGSCYTRDAANQSISRSILRMNRHGCVRRSAI